MGKKVSLLVGVCTSATVSSLAQSGVVSSAGSQPTLAIEKGRDGVSVVVKGTAGKNCDIQKVQDFGPPLRWVTLTNFLLLNPVQSWIDTNSSSTEPSAFYRASMQQEPSLLTTLSAGDGSVLTNIGAPNVTAAVTTNDCYFTVRLLPNSVVFPSNVIAAPLLGSSANTWWASNVITWGTPLGSKPPWYATATNSEGYSDWAFSFLTDAQDLEFPILTQGGTWDIAVDGDWQRSQSVKLDAHGNAWFLHLQFPTQRTRLVQAIGLLAGGYIQIPITNSIYSPGWRSQAVAVIGDSISEAVNTRHWPEWLFRINPTINILNESQGETGYANPGPAGRTNISQRIGAVLTNYKPRYVILAGGLNDLTWPTNDVYANVWLTLINIRQLCPGTKVMVLNAYWPRTPNDPLLQGVSDVLKAACRNAGGVASNIWFIDWLAEPVVSGNWNVPNSGNAVRVTSSDGTHPTEFGSQYLARKIYGYLRQIWPELFNQASWRPDSGF
jgi:lysophospholipase L1-like esterase